MGLSKTGGVFGFLKKSVGGVTYSTAKDSSGKKVQVVRAKITEMTNPNTVGQILQRMKIKPAQRFYDAINAADNSLILQHSFQGYQYVNDNRKRFMSLALAADGPYIPKNADQFIPAEYQVSEGSLPEVSIVGTKFDDNTSQDIGKNCVQCVVPGLTGNPSAETMPDVVKNWALAVCGGDAEMQMTFIYVTYENNMYVAHAFRTISGQISAAVVDTNYLSIEGHPVFLWNDGDASSKRGVSTRPYNGVPTAKQPVALAIILSKKNTSGQWARSSQVMRLTPVLYENIYGANARELAISSYETSETLNSLNSQWYLNLASNQAFNGQVSFVTNGDNQSVIIGYTIDGAGNQIAHVFTQNGAGTDKVMEYDAANNQFKPAESQTGEAYAADWLYEYTFRNRVMYDKLTEAIIAQAGLNATIYTAAPGPITP